MPSDKEIELLKEDLEISDKDFFELLGHTANDFNSNGYLSDGLGFVLTDENTSREYADLKLAYIMEQNISEEEKIEIVKSLIELYENKSDLKQYGIRFKVNQYALNKLLYTLGVDIKIETKRKDLVVNQLKSVLRQDDNNILLKLVAAKDVKTLKSYLNKMEMLFKLKDEKSQYRIGIVLLLFIERCKLLLPTIRDNLSMGTSLIAEYYGIEAPTYRRKKLTAYIDKNHPSKPLYDIIRNNHIDFWRMIQS